MKRFRIEFADSYVALGTSKIYNNEFLTENGFWLSTDVYITRWIDDSDKDTQREMGSSLWNAIGGIPIVCSTEIVAMTIEEYTKFQKTYKKS